MTITGLKPETTYAVRLSAVNGKGVGELSLPAEFKTQPVRKYSPAPSAPLSWSLCQAWISPFLSHRPRCTLCFLCAFGLEWVLLIIKSLL